MRSLFTLLIISLLVSVNLSATASESKRRSKSKKQDEQTVQIDSVALLSAQNALLQAQLDHIQTTQDSLEQAEINKLNMQDSLARLSLFALSGEDKANFYDSLVSNWYYDHLPAMIDGHYVDLESDSTLNYGLALSDSIYKERLDAIMSPIHLPYNDILRGYLLTYTTTRKQVVSVALARSHYYFSIIEEQLDKYGLPMELRSIPIIESLLNPTAISRMGATGMWQFMYTTGKIYKLEVSSFLDQRRDPIASTKAACEFLGDLYKIYGDWTIAISAYNCGPGNVNKAIKRAGGNVSNFWDIYDYLPRETRGYLPSIIAVNYACNYHRQHGIEPAESEIPLLLTDTVTVNKLTHFDQISSTIEVPTELLRILNPQYKLDIIPALDKSYTLTLPQNEVINYLDKEAELMAKDTVYLAKYVKSPSLAQAELSSSSTIYRVKSGDTLGAIAKRHSVSLSSLLKWNNLSKTSILRIGQRIEINR